MLLTQLLESSNLQWAEIQMMLLELLSSGATWLIGAGSLILPVVISWGVRNLWTD